MYIYEEISKALQENKKFVLATVVDVKGSSPNEVGSKMLVFEDGSIANTIGGGKLEALVIKKSKEVIEKQKPEILKYNLTENQSESIGMLCGGEVNIFIEPIKNNRLIIIGAGHVAQKIAQLGSILNMDVTVIDDREEFANSEKFPTANNIIMSDILSSIEKLSINEQSFLIIVTRGHKLDEKVLRMLINKNVAYLGMIGSKRKVKIILDRLKSENIPEEYIEKVFSPIGLDIGSQTPAEIAVSIMAEIINVQRKGNVHISSLKTKMAKLT